MVVAAIWMLLAEGETAARAAPLRARIAAGARGDALRRVDLGDASEEARTSSVHGAELAYTLLYREKYIDRRLIVRFDADAPLVNVQGRSADLAFALALAANLTRADGDLSLALPPLAATGVMNEEGRLTRVEAMAAKLDAAIAALPSGGVVVYPRENEADVTADLAGLAARRGIELLPSASLEEALRGLGVTLSQTWLDTPFRGLEPFEFRHAAIFFGRDQEIEDVLTVLRQRAAQGRRAVLVEGPSGGGKSSLVLAGVIPALLRRGGLDRPAGGVRWGLLRAGTVRPNPDAERERQDLAAAVQAAFLHADQGAVSPRAPIGAIALSPEALLDWLAGDAAPAERPAFVLVADQLEQWFDAGLQPATLNDLGALLSGLAERGCTIIATATGAISQRLTDLPALSAAFGVEGRYQIPRQLDAARMEAVIRGPARAARLHFEPGLDAEIFSAASQGGADVLPLLELLLTELYERRDPARNLLRRADYLAVGGLDGVISSRAELAFAQAGPSEQAAFPELIWRLSTRGDLPLSDYPVDGPMARLVAALQARRLLIAQAGPRAEPLSHDHHQTDWPRPVNERRRPEVAVRPAHEALLRQWPRAVDERRRADADIGRWLDLMREAGQWARGERSPIPIGPQLDAAETLVQRRQGNLIGADRPVLTYIAESIRRRDQRDLAIRILIGGPALVGAIWSLFVLGDRMEASHRLVVDFASVSVPGPDYKVPAAPTLHKYGISVLGNDPASALPIILGNLGLYQGQGAAPAVSQHFLTQMAEKPAAPVSYTLAFERPLKAVSLRRPALWGATCSGVTHPQWTAEAKDRDGRVLARSSEILERAIPAFDPRDRSKACPYAGVFPFDVPATTYTLQAPAGKMISKLTITSDYRLDGVPFAAEQAVLIEEMVLIR
jgi:hypothetical protein